MGTRYFPSTPRRQPPRKGKKLRRGETRKEPKAHNDVGQFVVDLQEEAIKREEEIARLRQENREMKRRVVVAEETARKAGVEMRRMAFGREGLRKRIRDLASAVAQMAKESETETDESDDTSAASKMKD